MKKTKLKWTKKLPTVDGFYWWRHGPKNVRIYMLVVEDEIAVGVGQCQTIVEHWEGQWYGPIPSKEPKQQLNRRPYV